MSNSVKYYKHELKNIYNKIIDNDDHVLCPSFNICNKSCKWDNERELLFPTGAWVGNNYGKTGILFLGINTNQGSKDSKTFWAPKEWYCSNQEHIGRATNQIIKKIWDKKINHKESIHYYTFTNVIKCSVRKKSGEPTDTMLIRCPYIEKYLFQELKVLKPKVIFAFGESPFNVVQNLHIDSVKEISNNFKEWLFKYSIDNDEVFVCRLYNPGQGYRTPRTIFKKMSENKDIKDWMRFISDENIKRGNIADNLINKYDEENRIDIANPFYDEMFNTLWNQISSQVKLKDN